MGWSSPQRGFVEAAALRQEQGLEHGNVDLDALAERLKIEVVYAPSKASPIEGMYLRRGGRAFALVNSERAATRQRFTLAHEIGHHVFARNAQEVEVVDLDYLREKKGEERQVNLFASALLMDAHGVRAAVADLPFEDAIATVVRSYEVSVDTAAIRLSELDLAGARDVGGFLNSLRDPDFRSKFMWRHDLDLVLNAGRYRVRLPEHFRDRAHRLFGAEYISEARFEELVNRPKPVADHA